MSRIHPDHNELAAYVVFREPGPEPVRRLRSALAEVLPEYMIPAHIVPMAALPLNAHGKIDRPALPEIAERAELGEHELPQDEVEQKLVSLWCAALNRERIGVNDNYFELGGDSLSVLSMVLDVETAFGRPVSQAFFRTPTIRHLAEVIRTTDGQTAPTATGFQLAANRAVGARPPGAARNPLRRWLARLRANAKGWRTTLDVIYPFEWTVARATRR
jgi:acyl carrier protein